MINERLLIEEARKYEGFRDSMREAEAHESAGRYHGFIAGAKWAQNTLNAVKDTTSQNSVDWISVEEFKKVFDDWDRWANSACIGDRNGDLIECLRRFKELLPQPPKTDEAQG